MGEGEEGEEREGRRDRGMREGNEKGKDRGMEGKG